MHRAIAEVTVENLGDIWDVHLGLRSADQVRRIVVPDDEYEIGGSCMTSELTPKFKPGDRVLMVKHADWKGPATATISREGRTDRRSDGYEFLEYIIKFDRPQTDSIDEDDGEPISYSHSTCMEEFLRPLDGNADI